MGSAVRSSVRMDESAPPYLPKGVRIASQMKTESIVPKLVSVSSLLSWEEFLQRVLATCLRGYPQLMTSQPPRKREIWSAHRLRETSGFRRWQPFTIVRNIRQESLP